MPSELIVHHLGISQSERIVWLCEELGVEYTLRRHERAPLLAPAELKQLPGNDLGAAPVLQDGPVTLCESGAIAEYLLTRHNPRNLMRPPPDSPDYPAYLYWLHAANGTVFPRVSREMALATSGLPINEKVRQGVKARRDDVLRLMDARLAQVPYLAGEHVSAADAMNAFNLSTLRYWAPFSLAPFPNILAWLKRISERPAYRRAMEKGDPGMELLLGPEAPSKPIYEKL